MTANNPTHNAHFRTAARWSVSLLLLVLAGILTGCAHEVPGASPNFVYDPKAPASPPDRPELALLVPVSKYRASASFVLVSLGLGALIFYGFHLLNARTWLRLPVVGAWGRNALLLYLLHGAVIGLFALPQIPAWYVEAPPWLIVAQAAALLGVLSAIGLYLDRHKWYWTL